MVLTAVRSRIGPISLVAALFCRLLLLLGVLLFLIALLLFWFSVWVLFTRWFLIIMLFVYDLNIYKQEQPEDEFQLAKLLRIPVGQLVLLPLRGMLADRVESRRRSTRQYGPLTTLPL